MTFAVELRRSVLRRLSSKQAKSIWRSRLPSLVKRRFDFFFPFVAVAFAFLICAVPVITKSNNGLSALDAPYDVTKFGDVFSGGSKYIEVMNHTIASSHPFAVSDFVDVLNRYSASAYFFLIVGANQKSISSKWLFAKQNIHVLRVLGPFGKINTRIADIPSGRWNRRPKSYRLNGGQILSWSVPAVFYNRCECPMWSDGAYINLWDGYKSALDIHVRFFQQLIGYLHFRQLSAHSLQLKEENYGTDSSNAGQNNSEHANAASPFSHHPFILRVFGFLILAASFCACAMAFKSAEYADDNGFAW